MNSIRELDLKTASLLRSSLSICTYAQAVEEVVFNAIDAGATSISITVNFSTLSFEVSDNGFGIEEEDFSLIGERYATSKIRKLEDLKNLTTLGFRGEALASLKETSTLEIISRSSNSFTTYSKIFQDGCVLFLGPSVKKRSSVGSTVRVHNFLHSLPVRQKRLVELIEIESLSKRLEGLYLIRPYLTIILKDEVNSQEILKTKRCESKKLAFRLLYGNLKLLCSCEFYELAEACDRYALSGIVCSTGYYSKEFQFLYVNSRLVQKSQFHRLLDRIFDHTAIGSRWAHVQPGGRENVFGVYVLNFSCSPCEVDIGFEPARVTVEFKDWSPALRFFRESLLQFFNSKDLLMNCSPTFSDTLANGNIPQDLIVKRDSAAYNTCSHRNSVESGDPLNNDATTIRREVTGKATKLYVAEKISEKKFGFLSDFAIYRSCINNFEDKRNHSPCKPRNCSSHTAGDWGRTKSAGAPPESSDASGKTVVELFRNWVNPTFAFIGQPRHSKNLVGVPVQFHKEMLKSARVLRQVDKKFIACRMAYTDPTGDRSEPMDLLVFVDQHAAHERIRLENYFELVHQKEICTVLLDPPLLVDDLRGCDVGSLNMYSRELEKWGVFSNARGSGALEITEVSEVFISSIDSDSVTSLLKTAVHELIQTMRSLCGIAGTIPRCFLDVLNRLSCRGAIKFGDKLDYAECARLLDSLSRFAFSVCPRPSFHGAFGRLVNVYGHAKALTQFKEVRQQIKFLLYKSWLLLLGTGSDRHAAVWWTAVLKENGAKAWPPPS
ncbi:DNA mismatch repair protein Mlh3-like isoform X2 [Zophobas morio]|uniref:DNA mismatch repair protein Mlh3-like isoform X2 n=1 Tax=Zophobas morio TaxID=2755281 RepID=UPI003082C042